MQTSRRNFIKKSSMAVAASAMLSSKIFAAKHTPAMIGVQLYSVRDAMDANPLETLKKVAAIGYKNVEHANYREGKFYGYTPAEFKKILNDLGLKMPSGHTTMGRDTGLPQKKISLTSGKKQLKMLQL